MHDRLPGSMRRISDKVCLIGGFDQFHWLVGRPHLSYYDAETGDLVFATGSDCSEVPCSYAYLPFVRTN